MTYRGNLGWLLSVIGVAANVGSWRRYTALLICTATRTTLILDCRDVLVTLRGPRTYITIDRPVEVSKAIVWGHRPLSSHKAL